LLTPSVSKRQVKIQNVKEIKEEENYTQPVATSMNTRRQEQAPQVIGASPSLDSLYERIFGKIQKGEKLTGKEQQFFDWYMSTNFEDDGVEMAWDENEGVQIEYAPDQGAENPQEDQL
jgi:hypothetical protein